MNRDLRIEAFVMAGGKSSRMGRDKGLVLLNERPMVSYALDLLAGLDLPVKMIANDPVYGRFGFPVFPDVVKEKGPLGGLLAAFENTEADLVFLLSCDMPLIPESAAEKLLRKAEGDCIACFKTDEQIDPLFALYPVSLKEDVQDRISSGRLKMTDFILENRHTLISSGPEEERQYFRNINTPIELKEVEEKWSNLK